MKNILITLTAILASLTTVYAANGQYDVRTFGAVGDGVHIDSPAINAALEQAARVGGGTVVLPPGHLSQLLATPAEQCHPAYREGRHTESRSCDRYPRLRRGRAQRVAIPGLRTQPLAQLAPLGR